MNIFSLPNTRGELTDRFYLMVVVIFFTVALAVIASVIKYWFDEPITEYINYIVKPVCLLSLVYCVFMVFRIANKKRRNNWQDGVPEEDSFIVSIFKKSLVVSWLVAFFVVTKLDKIVKLQPQADPVDLASDVTLAAMLITFCIAFLIMNRSSDAGDE